MHSLALEALALFVVTAHASKRGVNIHDINRWTRRGEGVGKEKRRESCLLLNKRHTLILGQLDPYDVIDVLFVFGGKNVVCFHLLHGFFWHELPCCNEQYQYNPLLHQIINNSRTTCSANCKCTNRPRKCACTLGALVQHRLVG